MIEVPPSYLLITNIPPEEWLFKVEGFPQVIGRSRDCDIVIPDKYRQVSRKHAQIEYRQNAFWINDVGSSGGTKLNGVDLVRDKPTQMVIGDRIGLAGLELYFISAEAQVLQQVADSSAKQLQSHGTILVACEKPTGFNSDVGLRNLSPAELDVLRWISRGLITDIEIGHKLFRSPHTVRTQLCSIFQKLDVHSREQLIGLLKRREIAWTKSPALDDHQSPKTDDSMRIVTDSKKPKTNDR
jgi:DNA-binding CsgD family transcriptional regulator